MIVEDYVSFETAKLLKEKGFDSENVSEFGGFYIDFYHNGQYPGIATESMMLNKTLSYWEYLRPTLQMAMKYLREVYNMHIEVKFLFESHIYMYTITYTPVALDNISSYPQCFDTYEEACESAIKYCLKNLI